MSHLRKFYSDSIIQIDNINSNYLDEGMIVFYENPNSFTGEDIFEF